tara:strand:+ start:64 stop:465 length:402 start_codon:yes stop_codon:yes gene_type:complete
MSYNGKVYNSHPDGMDVARRTIDIEIPKEVMEQLYIPIDGKVYINDNGNFTAKMKLDNSEGGKELDLGLRINGELPSKDWWDSGSSNIQRTIKDVPNEVLSYLGLGYADDQIRIKFTLDTSTWSAIIEKVSVT